MRDAGDSKMPVCFVIFGITGDLSRSKLIPAIFNLYKRRQLPNKFKVVGYSRRDIAPADFRNYVKEIIGKDDRKFLDHFTYVQGQFDPAADYRKLSAALSAVDDLEFGECSHKLFYLAVPPIHYGLIAKRLSASGLTIPCGGRTGWTRVLIEKPFGRDITTARKLNLELAKLFKEEQIFRIDHYLGKAASQKILDFRFAGGSREKNWNNKYIERLEIDLLEKEGVKHRGAFYDEIGALRDVGQNHILQMLALTTMRRPRSLSSGAIRAERAKILESLRPFKPGELKEVVRRGQYEGYRKEEGVDHGSQTETFFDMTVELMNKNWKGVPIKLRSGKGLPENRVEARVYFKRILKPVKFDYRHQGKNRMDAYEKVLLDCVRGDQTIFTSTREVEAAWEFITPILRLWKKLPLTVYQRGTMPKID